MLVISHLNSKKIKDLCGSQIIHLRIPNDLEGVIRIPPSPLYTTNQIWQIAKQKKNNDLCWELPPPILPKPPHVSACFILIKQTGSSYNTGAVQTTPSAKNKKQKTAKTTLVQSTINIMDFCQCFSSLSFFFLVSQISIWWFWYKSISILKTHKDK